MLDLMSCFAHVYLDVGSDVNSMDSVDSCSALGTRSGSQASQTQSSELIVWEIEVPKVSSMFN